MCLLSLKREGTGNMAFEAAKTYEITHSRKGKLTVRVVSVEGEWVHTRIVDGVEKKMSGRGAGPGDNLTFRESFACIIREIEPTT